MNVSSIKGMLPNEIIESLKERGINEFTPPQADAISKVFLKTRT